MPLTMTFGLALLGVGFLMPGHYVPWVSFEQQAAPALGALLIGATALREGHRLALPAIALAALLLAAVPLLQFAVGQVDYRSDAFVSSAYLAALAACIVTGRSLALTADDRSRLVTGLAWALLAAALASAVIALVQWQQLRWSIFIVDLQPGGRPFGNLAQPNHLATLLALGFVAGLCLYESRRIGSVTLAVAAVLLGWGLVMTQSRTGWLFAALLLLWWAWQRRAVALRLPGTALAAALALYIAGIAAWSPINDALLLSAPADLESRLQGGTRWIHWPTLWDAAWRQPWFGYGWGQVVHAQQAAVLDHPPVGEWLLQSHNLLLDLMIYNGVPLGLAVFGLLVWWFVRHIRACRSVEQWALIAAVGTVFTHALLEYPLDYAYFLLPTGLMMGALEALHPQPAARWALPRGAFACLLAGLAAMLVWISIEYVKVESATRQLRFVMLGIGVDKVPDAPVPDVWLLDQPREFHRYWMTPATTGMSTEQLDWMRRVSMREPRPPAQLRYALAAGLNGRLDEAAVTLARLCQLHPALRCDEGRESWLAAQQQHPVLRSIPYPPTPAELR
jgi:O-antigen ligase